jgi:hypothetical protein
MRVSRNPERTALASHSRASQLSAPAPHRSTCSQRERREASTVATSLIRVANTAAYPLIEPWLTPRLTRWRIPAHVRLTGLLHG